MCANQLEVANLQCGVARSQMFSGEFARCCGRSVVGGGRLSDATTWTIVILMRLIFGKEEWG